MPAMILKEGNDEHGKPFVICELSELTGQLTTWRYHDDNGKPATMRTRKKDEHGNWIMVPVPAQIVVHLSPELIEKHAKKLEPIPSGTG